MTRAEAKHKGVPRFYSGEPCRMGHYSDRWTANNACIQCEYEKAAKRREENGPRQNLPYHKIPPRKKKPLVRPNLAPGLTLARIMAGR